MSVDLERFCIKFFAQPDYDIDDTIFIEVFHEWIRLKKLEQVMLDVADYRHVPEGPGIMLVTHEINFALDYTDGQFGLYAQRKLGTGETHPERLAELLKATIAFGALLESDPRVQGKLSFDGGSFHYMANDRLLAPNNIEAFEAIKPDISAAIAPLYSQATVSRLENDPRSRLTAVVDSGTSTTLSALAA